MAFLCIVTDRKRAALRQSKLLVGGKLSLVPEGTIFLARVSGETPDYLEEVLALQGNFWYSDSYKRLS